MTKNQYEDPKIFFSIVIDIFYNNYRDGYIFKDLVKNGYFFEFFVHFNSLAIETKGRRKELVLIRKYWKTINNDLFNNKERGYYFFKLPLRIKDKLKIQSERKDYYTKYGKGYININDVFMKIFISNRGSIVPVPIPYNIVNLDIDNNNIEKERIRKYIYTWISNNLKEYGMNIDEYIISNKIIKYYPNVIYNNEYYSNKNMNIDEKWVKFFIRSVNSKMTTYDIKKQSAKYFNYFYYLDKNFNNVDKIRLTNKVREYFSLIEQNKIDTKLTLPYFNFSRLNLDSLMPSYFSHWYSSVFSYRKKENRSIYLLDTIFTKKLLNTFFAIKYLHSAFYWNPERLSYLSLVYPKNIFAKKLNYFIKLTSLRTASWHKDYTILPSDVYKFRWLRKEMSFLYYVKKLVYKNLTNTNAYHINRETFWSYFWRPILSIPRFKHTATNVIIDVFIFNNKKYKIKKFIHLLTRRGIYKYMYSLYANSSEKIQDTLNKPRFFYLNLIEPNISSHYNKVINLYHNFILNKNKSTIISSLLHIFKQNFKLPFSLSKNYFDIYKGDIYYCDQTTKKIKEIQEFDTPLKSKQFNYSVNAYKTYLDVHKDSNYVFDESKLTLWSTHGLSPSKKRKKFLIRTKKFGLDKFTFKSFKKHNLLSPNKRAIEPKLAKTKLMSYYNFSDYQKKFGKPRRRFFIDDSGNALPWNQVKKKLLKKFKYDNRYLNDRTKRRYLDEHWKPDVSYVSRFGIDDKDYVVYDEKTMSYNSRYPNSKRFKGKSDFVDINLNDNIDSNYSISNIDSKFSISKSNDDDEDSNLNIPIYYQSSYYFTNILRTKEYFSSSKIKKKINKNKKIVNNQNVNENIAKILDIFRSNFNNNDISSNVYSDDKIKNLVTVNSNKGFLFHLALNDNSSLLKKLLVFNKYIRSIFDLSDKALINLYKTIKILGKKESVPIPAPISKPKPKPKPKQEYFDLHVEKDWEPLPFTKVDPSKVGTKVKFTIKYTKNIDTKQKDKILKKKIETKQYDKNLWDPLFTTKKAKKISNKYDPVVFNPDSIKEKEIKWRLNNMERHRDKVLNIYKNKKNYLFDILYNSSNFTRGQKLMLRLYCICFDKYNDNFSWAKRKNIKVDFEYRYRFFEQNLAKLIFDINRKEYSSKRKKAHRDGSPKTIDGIRFESINFGNNNDIRNKNVDDSINNNISSKYYNLSLGFSIKQMFLPNNNFLHILSIKKAVELGFVKSKANNMVHISFMHPILFERLQDFLKGPGLENDPILKYYEEYKNLYLKFEQFNTPYISQSRTNKFKQSKTSKSKHSNTSKSKDNNTSKSEQSNTTKFKLSNRSKFKHSNTYGSLLNLPDVDFDSPLELFEFVYPDTFGYDKNINKSYKSDNRDISASDKSKFNERKEYVKNYINNYINNKDKSLFKRVNWEDLRVSKDPLNKNNEQIKGFIDSSTNSNFTQKGSNKIEYKRKDGKIRWDLSKLDSKGRLDYYNKNKEVSNQSLETKGDGEKQVKNKHTSHYKYEGNKVVRTNITFKDSGINKEEMLKDNMKKLDYNDKSKVSGNYSKNKNNNFNKKNNSRGNMKEYHSLIKIIRVLRLRSNSDNAPEWYNVHVRSKLRIKSLYRKYLFAKLSNTYKNRIAKNQFKTNPNLYLFKNSIWEPSLSKAILSYFIVAPCERTKGSIDDARYLLSLNHVSDTYPYNLRKIVNVIPTRLEEFVFYLLCLRKNIWPETLNMVKDRVFKRNTWKKFNKKEWVIEQLLNEIKKIVYNNNKLIVLRRGDMIIPSFRKYSDSTINLLLKNYTNRIKLIKFVLNNKLSNLSPFFGAKHRKLGDKLRKKYFKKIMNIQSAVYKPIDLAKVNEFLDLINPSDLQILKRNDILNYLRFKKIKDNNGKLKWMENKLHIKSKFIFTFTNVKRKLKIGTKNIRMVLKDRIGNDNVTYRKSNSDKIDNSIFNIFNKLFNISGKDHGKSKINKEFHEEGVNKINTSGYWYSMYYLSYLRKEYNKIRRDIIVPRESNYHTELENINVIEPTVLEMSKKNIKGKLNIYLHGDYNVRDVIYNDKIIRSPYRYLLNFFVYKKYINTIRKWPILYWLNNLNILPNNIRRELNFSLLYDSILVKTMFDIIKYNYRSLLNVNAEFYILDKIRYFKSEFNYSSLFTYIFSAGLLKTREKAPDNFWQKFDRVSGYIFERVKYYSILNQKRNFLLPFTFYFEDILYSIYGKFGLVRLWPLKRKLLSTSILAQVLSESLNIDGQGYKTNHFKNYTKSLIRVRKYIDYAGYENKKWYKNKVVNNWPSNLLNLDGISQFKNYIRYDPKLGLHDNLVTYNNIINDTNWSYKTVNNKFFFNLINDFNSSYKRFNTSLSFHDFISVPLRRYINYIKDNTDLVGYRTSIKGRSPKPGKAIRAIYEELEYGNLSLPLYYNKQFKLTAFSYKRHRVTLFPHRNYQKFSKINRNGVLTLRLWLYSRLNCDIRDSFYHLSSIRGLYNNIVNKEYNINYPFYLNYKYSYLNKKLLPNVNNIDINFIQNKNKTKN
jgi:hypothetical protein